MADEPVQEQIDEPEPQEPEPQPEFDFSSQAIKAKLDAERAQPEPEPEPASEPEPVAQETRPRDDQGRFVKERPDWLPDQYKTVDDFVRSHDEAQQVIGRLGQEVGDLRQQVQQYAQPRYDTDEVDAWLEENPTAIPQVAENARLRGDTAMFQRATRAWAEIDPAGAQDYKLSVALQAQEQRLRAEFQQSTEPLTSRALTAEWGRAYAQFAADKPELSGDDAAAEAFADKMAEIAPQSKTLIKIISDPNAGHDERLEALDVLYYKAGGRGPTPGSPPPAPRTDKTTVGVATSSSGTGVTGDKRDAAISRFKQGILDAK